MAASNTRSQRILQNFHLVWLDANIDEVNNDDCRKSITQLRQIVNTVDTFVDIDKCIDFITDIDEAQVFLIVSDQFIDLAIPIAEEVRQISSIYIVSTNKMCDEKLTNKCHKVNGIFTNIPSICQAIQHDVRNFDANSVSISFVKKIDVVSKHDLDSLDKSFMYTQILKEILLTIDFEKNHINEFVSFCRKQFMNNSVESRNIDKIEKDYHGHEPIWWYTYQSFLYSMLNRALRLMQVDIIIKMGFFLKDLHNHIVELHSQQLTRDQHLDSFIVYRGQGLSQTDFDELQQTQGGLLSFNNFLSTSANRQVSLDFARRTINTSDLVGVLFIMQINPSIATTPFANVKDVSYYKREDEILFSMHSIFRIGPMKQLDDNTRLWEVDLCLTSDNDPQLYALAEHIRQETFPHQKGWERLGNLLIRLGHLDKAAQVYDNLLHQTTDEREKAHIYQMFGIIKNDQGKYEDAVKYYEESIKIDQKCLLTTHPDLSASYINIGTTYTSIGEHSKSLPYCEKALEIYEKTLPENHPRSATSYNNIGGVYRNMGEYSKALSYYEKALEIWKKTFPENHPDLAASYNNIGEVYNNMGEYSKALSYYEGALEIWKKTLPENHPDLAVSYNNIGGVYSSIGEYSKALSYYEKALEIWKKTLPENHSDLAISYNNIGEVYRNIGEYSKARSYYEKALEIKRKTLPENDPALVISYNNIGGVYYTMNDYRKALQYFERALDNAQRSFPSNHPHIRIIKESIEIVKKAL